MEQELEDLILNLTKDFETGIPEEEKERDAIIVEFKNYLYLAVKTIKESESKFIKKDIESIKSVLNRITNNYKQQDLDTIKRNLLEDSAFEKIRRKSIDIFVLAKNIMKGQKENIEFDKTTEIESMKNLLKDVKEYNQKQAQELLSEASIDAGYITNQNQEALSLRLYQFKKEKEIMEEER